MNRREYLKTITEQIRCEKAREGIAKELNGHIEDQKETFLKEGMTETEAEEAAVREMGDPVAAGVELDRIHRPKMPWGLIALIGILHAAGFFMPGSKAWCLCHPEDPGSWEKSFFCLQVWL